MGKLSKVIFAIALIVFLVSAGVLINYFLKGKAVQKDFEALKGDEGYDLAELYKKNKDIVGWIKIDGTRVDYPVMQTKDDPEFYLRRNFEKEESVAGTPFMDAACDIELPTLNWIIYGHHMKDGTMFHDVTKYEEEEFYKDHKTIIFDTLKEEGEYEVVAAFFSQIYNEDSSKFKYYDYVYITTQEELAEYARGVKALSIYDTGVEVEEGDRLITLSTCEYHTEDGRFAVVARKK